jgi:hypothetical protein
MQKPGGATGHRKLHATVMLPPDHAAVMFSLLLSRPARWFGSEFSQLPVFEHGESQSLRDYRLLAGGLALVLSRCSERVARRDFPASLKASRALRRQLRGGEPWLPSDQLSELSHEIAMVADAATREAARRCLQRNLRQAA